MQAPRNLPVGRAAYKKGKHTFFPRGKPRVDGTHGGTVGLTFLCACLRAFFLGGRSGFNGHSPVQHLVLPATGSARRRIHRIVHTGCRIGGKRRASAALVGAHSTEQAHKPFLHGVFKLQPRTGGTCRSGIQHGHHSGDNARQCGFIALPCLRKLQHLSIAGSVCHCLPPKPPADICPAHVRPPAAHLILLYKPTS